MLRIEDLHFRIGDFRILDGVSCTVHAGERLGIIGPNGSGKTSLFNCISGFNQTVSGRIYLRDTDITDLAPHRRALLGIGRVFQNFGIFRELTLLDNILVALESRERGILLPWSKAHRRNVVSAREALNVVGLAHRATEKARSLSGGQMRLLEISRSVAFGSEIFLLDEPTAGVSPKMKGDVENILRRLQDLKKTVLIIEHDINFIQRLCDRILVLDVGKLVLDDTPERVRTDPLLQEIYFGTNNHVAAVS